MRIVLTGGGTGGHIMPAIAVGEALKRLDPSVELLYIGGTIGMETQIVPTYGLAYQGVTAKKLRKLVSPGTIGVALSLVKGYREARTYLRAFKADAVVGTGGYVAAATVLAATRLGIRTVIVESNAVAGRTNLMLARWVDRICVTLEETGAQFPKGKTVATGLPLRAGVIAPPGLTPQDARCKLGLPARDRFTFLVLGGSQGARAINRTVLEAAPKLLATGVQILHQAGERNINDVKAASASFDEGYLPVAFLSDEQIPVALRAADLAMCRGGISTLSELLANGTPSVIVPLPTAYADHQTANAKALERVGAAMLLPESNLTAATIAETVQRMRSDRAALTAMSAACAKLARPNAADDVAREALTPDPSPPIARSSLGRGEPG